MCTYFDCDLILGPVAQQIYHVMYSKEYNAVTLYVWFNVSLNYWYMYVTE